MLIRAVAILALWVCLLAAILIAYPHRFVAEPDEEICNLSDMRLVKSESREVDWNPRKNAGLELVKLPEGKNLSAVLSCPPIGTVNGFHLSYRIKLKNLKQGVKKWQLGRMGISWISADGRRMTVEGVRRCPG